MATETIAVKPNILRREAESWDYLLWRLKEPVNQQALQNPGWFIVREAYDSDGVDHRLLTCFQLKENVQAVRLGPLSTYEEVFVYNPNKIEVVQQAIIKDKTDRDEAIKWFNDPDDKGNRRGYTLLLTSADRLVGYKNLQSTS